MNSMQVPHRGASSSRWMVAGLQVQRQSAWAHAGGTPAVAGETSGDRLADEHVGMAGSPAAARRGGSASSSMFCPAWKDDLLLDEQLPVLRARGQPVAEYSTTLFMGSLLLAGHREVSTTADRTDRSPHAAVGRAQAWTRAARPAATVSRGVNWAKATRAWSAPRTRGTSSTDRPTRSSCTTS